MKALSISYSTMQDHSKKYFKTIQNNQIILQQDINIFVESKLSKYDQSADYVIQNFIIVRADQKKTYQSTLRNNFIYK